MLRVTTDTNVLVSGLVFQRGKPFQFLRKAGIGLKIQKQMDDLGHEWKSLGGLCALARDRS